MKVIKDIPALKRWVNAQKKEGKSIGFVPTMGYLHKGHLSLLKKANAVADVTIVSIFVNPTQFGPNEDLDSYPVDLDRDLDLCRQNKADCVFIPTKTDMYPTGHQTYVLNNELGRILCGKSRPTHFRGVTTIVAKLFNLTQADYAVFGQKDAQQALIIKNMVRDLNFNTKIILEPIFREADGLAMSSRNKYLSQNERSQAVVLSHCVKEVEKAFGAGIKEYSKLKESLIKKIELNPACKIDYIEFVNATTLSPKFEPGDKVLFALAVFVGTTRLIDNTILTY